MAHVFSLTETDSWCYHEGSYGHNPEYGSTHTLTIAATGGEHTKTDYEDAIGNVRKSAASGAQEIWRIHTTGQAMVPESVSRTGSIGHEHSATLAGDTLTVTVHYGKTGNKKTTTLSVAKLHQQFLKNGRKRIEFKV